MQRLSQLPVPPHFTVEAVRPRSPEEPAFLHYVSRHVRTVDAQGRRSATLIYDEVDRPALDAVVIAAHFWAPVGDAEQIFVVLRSAVRPPVSLRQQSRSPLPEPENRGLWELPAGLVEPAEAGPDGLRAAATRELLEEAGFEVSPDQFRSLGPSAFPAPGIIAERQFFFHVRVDPESQMTPPLDGSPLEEAGQLVAVPLRAALDAARAGLLSDSKTELALRRLQEELLE
jgi:ADP-ribose pyrophosphatase